MDIVTYALLKGNVNNLADSIAGKYDPNTEYHAGQIVVYEYELKRALGTTTGEFDPTKWEDVKITDLLGGGGGESIIIRASSHKTVDTYEVPVLTDTQLTQAYNGVVAGKNVFIVDDLDTITSQVLDASSIDGIAVRVLFTDALILTYKENGVIESVNVKWRGNVELDTTLTKSGEAAEAKAVGDKLSKKMEYKILTFTGSVFTLDGQTLTFAEIKSLCLNTADFVYALYENRLYIPQYISNTNIFFDASYIQSDIPKMHRISINSSNQVSQFNFDLAKAGQIPTALPTPNKLTFTGAVTGEFDGSEAKTFNIPTGGGGGSEEWEFIEEHTVTADEASVTNVMYRFSNNKAYKKLLIILDESQTDGTSYSALRLGFSSTRLIGGELYAALVPNTANTFKTNHKYKSMMIERLNKTERLFTYLCGSTLQQYGYTDTNVGIGRDISQGFTHATMMGLAWLGTIKENAVFKCYGVVDNESL